MSEAFFVDGRGLGFEVLRKGIHRHLGSDVTIEPSSYNGIDGYTLSATQPQTLELLKDLVRRFSAVSVGTCKEGSGVVVPTKLVPNDNSIQKSGEKDHRGKCRTLSRLHLAGRRALFRSYVGPDRQTTPRYHTLLLGVIVLVVFFTSLCLAARYPTKSVRIVFVSISGLLFTALSVSVGTDLATKGDRKYIRNLGNTTLLVLLTIPLMTTLYVFIWYPELNRKLVGVSQDILTEARFPAVTLLQRLDWDAQAQILPVNYTKCFLGWLEAAGTTPMCKDLPQEALVPGQACNCSENWASPVVEDFIWRNIAYRYLSFTPSAALNSSVPTYIMALQVFFNYSASPSSESSSQKPNPSLHMAVYDPSLGLTDALESGYSRMVLINANGDSAVNLGLQYRQETGHPPAYDYTLGISTVPNMDLACTGSNEFHPCHTTLYLQLPTFDRTILKEGRAMDWLDVAASAGGYFSFVQVLSWLISGHAGAT